MDNYKIVKNASVWGLQFEVNELVHDGWTPQGALVIENGEYIQTMVKNGEPVLTEEAPVEETVTEIKNDAPTEVESAPAEAEFVLEEVESAPVEAEAPKTSRKKKKH